MKSAPWLLHEPPFIQGENEQEDPTAGGVITVVGRVVDEAGDVKVIPFVVVVNTGTLVIVGDVDVVVELLSWHSPQWTGHDITPSSS